MYIIWLAERKNNRKKKKELFFSNRELLSTRKHWTINPSLAQAHHRHYRHIAFISFQLKISIPFRKLSTKNTLHSIAFLFCFNFKYHFNFLCVKIMEKWSQDVVDIMHWNCLAWQQSASSGHPFFHPNPWNCPTISIPFQHVTIPATPVCAFYHQHCWVQIGFRHWTKPCSSRHTTRWNGF